MKKSWIWIVLFFFITSAYADRANKLAEKGLEAINKGEFREAISYFLKATQADPQVGDYFRLLSGAYYMNEQYQETVDACNQALSLPHGKDVEYDSWFNLAAAYEKLGKLDSAISSMKKCIELLPNSAPFFAILARQHNKKKQYDEAITAAKRAIELKFDDDLAYNQLGYAYLKKKQYDESLAALKKAIEIDPAHAFYHDDMGELFCATEDYDQAIKAFIKAFELEPNNKYNLKIMANTYRLMGKYDDAIAAINKAIALSPKEDASSFGVRSNLYRHKGSLEAALQDAEKAYSLDPANDWARYSKGAAYLDQGHYDESVKLLSQVKEGPRARVLEATAYAKQGKMKESEDIYTSIPEAGLSPKNVPLMEDRMALLKILKPYVAEHQVKARSLEAKGQYQQALLELSEALKTADETEAQAIQESIFSILRKNPSLPGMLPEEARECVLRGELLVKEGNFEKAAGEYKKAIRIAPYAVRLYYNSALIYAELKQYPEAIRQMKTYLHAAPDAPDARAVMDQIYKWEFMMEKGK